MTDDNEALLTAITAAVPPILTGLEALTFVGRHLHPPNLPMLVERVANVAAPVADGMEQLSAAEFPEHLGAFKETLLESGRQVGLAFDGLANADSDPMSAYRAMRHATRATEALYPLAQIFAPVSRFFLEEGARGDDKLLHKLAQAGAGGDNTGIIHAGGGKGERGAFSMYVPEYYHEARRCPLIVAMHGGSGNGGDFLWTWIKEARTRGAILVAPTAKGNTWSLMGPDVDSRNIEQMVNLVCERWNVDTSRMLLTGMSDGGTFGFVSGLHGQSPFTHLAPCSASFHPLLLDGVPRKRLKGLPVYLMHGVLDWMFPIDIARMANEALTAAGAQVVYREIEDLSHTYPRDENPKIMDWFLADEDSGKA